MKFKKWTLFITSSDETRIFGRASQQPPVDLDQIAFQPSDVQFPDLICLKMHPTDFNRSFKFFTDECIIHTIFLHTGYKIVIPKFHRRRDRYQRSFKHLLREDIAGLCIRTGIKGGSRVKLPFDSPSSSLSPKYRQQEPLAKNSNVT